MTRATSAIAPASATESQRVTGPARVDLSVIVVSWNSSKFLDGCLDSLFAQRDVSVQVIVVDNGSSDGSPALVRERHPRARLIELGSNRGFCAANNAGIAEATGAFVLFANSDIILDVDFGKEALAAFDRDPRIGIVGGKLLRFDRCTVDSAGQFMTRGRRVLERSYGAPDGPHLAREGYVFSICGAALVCRKEMLADISVGGEFFDSSYFAFSEDFDVGWRSRLAGWRAWYAPRAVGLHYRGGSESGGETRPWALPAFLRRPPALRFHILKNRWLTLLKNDSWRSVLRDLPFIAVRDAALLVTAAVSSPRVLLDLVRARPLLQRALEQRRAFLGRRGRWGVRRAGTPKAWTRWREPRGEDLDSA